MLIDPTARTTRPQRRPYQWNANVVVGAGKKHRPLRMRCLPMAPLLLPIVTNGDTGISRFQAAGGRTSRDRPTSYYIRSATRLKGRAVNWCHSRQRMCARSRRHDRSGNRICAANRELYAFFIMRKCYDLEAAPFRIGESGAPSEALCARTEYFSALKPRLWIRVVEAESVPVSAWCCPASASTRYCRAGREPGPTG